MMKPSCFFFGLFFPSSLPHHFEGQVLPPHCGEMKLPTEPLQYFPQCVRAHVCGQLHSQLSKVPSLLEAVKKSPKKNETWSNKRYARLLSKKGISTIPPAVVHKSKPGGQGEVALCKRRQPSETEGWIKTSKHQGESGL